MIHLVITAEENLYLGKLERLDNIVRTYVEQRSGVVMRPFLFRETIGRITSSSERGGKVMYFPGAQSEVPNAQARDRLTPEQAMLVNNNFDLIDEVVKYNGQSILELSVDPEDIRQAVGEALVLAAMSYDPYVQEPFRTYAQRQMISAASREIDFGDRLRSGLVTLLSSIDSEEDYERLFTEPKTEVDRIKPFLKAYGPVIDSLEELARMEMESPSDHQGQYTTAAYLFIFSGMTPKEIAQVMSIKQKDLNLIVEELPGYLSRDRS